MTNEEAVKVLEGMKVTIAIPKAAELQHKKNEAIDIAIEALNNSEIPNCSDLISRADALEAYSDLYWLDERLLNFKAELDNVYGNIRAIPSAHPKFDEWCTDCKEYNQDTHSCPRWNRVIRSTLNDAQPERKTGHWIPVPAINGRGGHECDQCHAYAPSYKNGDEYLASYCPNCGAKMEVEP